MLWDVIMHKYTLCLERKIRGAGRSIIGGGAHIYIFVFCLISSFWNRNSDFKINCFHSLWIHEYVPPPPIIDLPAPLRKILWFIPCHLKNSFSKVSQYFWLVSFAPVTNFMIQKAYHYINSSPHHVASTLL